MLREKFHPSWWGPPSTTLISATEFLYRNNIIFSCFEMHNVGLVVLDIFYFESLSLGLTPRFEIEISPVGAFSQYEIQLNTYTGEQKKGYKVICLLFYKTEWHIIFAYCKHNVCCFWVDLPNLNQVQWSKTSARQFEWFFTTCTISQLLGTMEAKYSLW